MRYALGVEYDGQHYHGWQRQNHVNSVQEKVESALSTIANHPISVICAGRTDTGVSATNQVIHFDSSSQRTDAAWTKGVNNLLPYDIAIKWVQGVSVDFHARFSATARQYRYIIYNNELRSAILNKGLTFIYNSLDVELMHQAAQTLIGEHDFTSFRTVHCQSHSPVRTIEFCHVYRHNSYIIIDIKANAFLHHMVRNIVGSLVVVGQQHKPVSWLKEVLNAKNRQVAGMTAPSAGLYFVGVDYPAQFSIPKMPLGPLFFT